ncbi:MAG: thiamine pyrophosphate-dependent dehydrogenase E1 component subunit alpha [Candidatus Marsarchaeota archaeon]|nr:thiamine pyrophosphate-dependent dehydrogenase E1 component subunit alpha [Candidatus Marsarchaeota archaeon]
MDSQTSKRLYHQLLRIRLVEEKIADLYPEQEIRCPTHFCIGQEAIAVGVCSHLSDRDYVLSGHRSHGHYLAKGGDLRAMMAELYGKATGCSSGKGGSMHLVDLKAGFLGAAPIVGSTIPMGVGAALGSVMRGENRVTAVFFGDGATEEGVFCESINFAALKRLPVVFVCENNCYSVYSPLSVRQPTGREIFHLAAAHGVESHQADGNDIAEVHRLAGQAVRKARQGDGPTFLEFKTYRWREHCGPCYDDDLGYRPEGEFQSWKERCPVEEFGKRLLNDGTLTSQDVENMLDALNAEIREAIDYAKRSPFPPETCLLEEVFAP